MVGQEEGAGWVSQGVQTELRQLPRMKSHWFQAGAWNEELSTGREAEGIAPLFWGIWAGRDWSSWPRTRAPGHASLWLSHPPMSQICTEQMSLSPVPLGSLVPLALLWEEPTVPPAAFLELSLVPKHQFPLPCPVTTYLALVIGLFIATLPSVLEPGEGQGAKYNSITS